MRVNVYISARRDLAKHGLIVGGSGSGKTSLLSVLAYQLILASNLTRKFSVMLIDPHSDWARACMSFAMLDRSRLYYLSSSINSEAKTDKEYTFVFNPFHYDGSAEMRYLLTETLTENLCELLQDATLTAQMISVIRPCIATVLRLPPAQRSFNTLARFFREGDNLDLIEFGRTSEVEQHRIFFSRWHTDTHLSISKNSLAVKLGFFLSDPKLALMLNGNSTIDLEQAINAGSVIILNLPEGSGSFATKVMGKLMLAYLHALMMRRHTLEPSQRRPLYLLLDEFSFVTPSLGTLLAQARKWGLSVTIAGQSLGQISDTTLRKTIMVNTGLKAVGLTDYQDRAAFAKEMGISDEDLEALRPLQFILKRNDGAFEALKLEVPFLHPSQFLSKKDKQALLDWLVYDSGQYVPVQPAPPATPSSDTYNKAFSTKAQKKQPKQTPPSTNGLKPAF